MSTFLFVLDRNLRIPNMELQQFNSEIDDLLIRYQIGTASPDERHQILSWLKEDKDHARYFDQLKDLYQLGKVTKEPSGFDSNVSLERIKRKFYQIQYKELKNIDKQPSSPRFSIKVIISAAASILLAISLGFFGRYFLEEKSILQVGKSIVYNEITTPLGSRSHVTLPDGTRVWLNAGSKIRYAMDFLKGDREIALTGEAFFEVSKIKNKRFIVKTSDLAIKVWGTKFNVRAYSDDAIIQTTLVEGSVSIQKLNGKMQERETYLTPNQTAIFHKNIHNTNKQKVNSKIAALKSDSLLKIEPKINTVLYTSWKDAKWIIEGQTLGSLAKEFERRYNVQITFDNEAIKNYKFNGILTDETFEQVLKVIRFSAPIDFSVSNNHAFLKENRIEKNVYDKYLKKK